MITANTIADVRTWEREAHAAGKKIGLVPTMGALHEAHVALIRRAKELCDEVVVSIFVNPTQFGPSEDFASYPRTLDADLAKCEAEGVACAFAPSVEEMYPQQHRTFVEVRGLSEKMEGESRPGHFRGVCTVVFKLFEIVRPDAAVFGWKDAQQFLILRRMVDDMNIPVRMEPLETVREADGLAMSSRNAYLTDAERRVAPTLQQSLQAGLARVIAGARDTLKVREVILSTLANAPEFTLDRLDIVAMDTLDPLDRIDPGNTLIAIAARLGKARLIDNVRC